MGASCVGSAPYTRSSSEITLHYSGRGETPPEQASVIGL